MKRIKLIPFFLVTLLAVGMWACSDDEVPQEFLTPVTGSEEAFSQGLTFTGNGLTQSVKFEVGTDWTASINEEASAWCSVSPTNGVAGTKVVSVTAQKNDQNQERTATLTLTAGSIVKQIAIKQEAAPKVYPAGLSWEPETPDADQPLTIYYKADASSALKGYTGNPYVHIGLYDGAWSMVQAEWSENIDKCKMTAVDTDVWSISLTPSIREWFASGTTGINQIALVVRSSDGTKQTADLYVPVKDSKYGFTPAAVVEKSLPAGMVEGINVVDNSTVTLVLYDQDKNGKHKDFAHVVGDFNDWTLANDETSQMYRDDAAGCWWITLTGLDASKEYAFQYYVGTTDGEALRLADAYTEKILDPDNDKYITSASYTYPEKGRGIVSTFKIQKDSYSWKVPEFKIGKPESMVIYELHLRDFTETGDLSGALAKLDYLSDMGVNAIELMPTQEFDGNDSWGYNPCFFFAMDKAYGTKQQYKEFIDACHERGMAVILDVVYNHATGNHPFAKLYWDAGKNCTAENNPWFNVEAPHPYSVFHDFNHESELTRNFVKRNLKFLLEEYNLDGFRFDLTKGFTNNKSDESSASNYDASRVAILKDYNAAIKEAKADAFVILEHFCDTKEETELAADGLHMWRNMNNAYCQTAMGWWEESSFTGMYEETPAWVGFMESHDEERMAYKQSQWGNYDLKTNKVTAMSQLGVNAAFALTVPGPKMIWQFGELGYDISIDYNDRTGRKPIHWDYLEDEDRKTLCGVYSKLLKLRNDNHDLFDCTAALEWSVDNVAESTWTAGRSIYLKSTSGKELVVLGNFTDTTVSVAFPATTGEWDNYIEEETETIGSTVSLPAHSFKVLTNF